MTASTKDLRILYQKSGNRCAFPGCLKTLTFEEGPDGTLTSISEVAHIVAESLDGPRGTYPLPPGEREKYDNLILLCEEHHHVVDANPASYPVEMLHRWKQEHELLMSQATGQAVQSRRRTPDKDNYITEAVYSTLLPVTHMPEFIYTAPCKYDDSQESKAKSEVIHPASNIMSPFIIRDGRLISFNNLRYGGNPFLKLIGDTKQVARYESVDWWTDPDYARWFVQLLNRSLNKLTGRKGLNWDRDHYRYYFQPSEAGETVEISYQPLNQAESKRLVVWQPITRRTGIGKRYWFHLAVALRFLQVSPRQWCLSIRPEMHISKDGLEPYPSKKIGSRITRRISLRHNYDLLGDVQFWRDFLSDNKPRVLLSFGRKQYIAIDNAMMVGEIAWPGMPEEHAKPFKNVQPPETLFTWAELEQLERLSDDGRYLGGVDEEELEEDDEELS